MVSKAVEKRNWIARLDGLGDFGPMTFRRADDLVQHALVNGVDADTVELAGNFEDGVMAVILRGRRATK